MEGKVLLVVMANGRFFGSGLCIAPQAVADGRDDADRAPRQREPLLIISKQPGAVRRGE